MFAVVGRRFGRKYNRTTVVAMFCVGIVTGVLASGLMSFDWILLVPALFVYLIPKRHLGSLLLATYLGITLGLFRATSVNNQYDNLDSMMGQKIKIIVVAKEDGSYDLKKRIAFQAEATRVVSPQDTALTVPVKINTFISSGVFKGDVLLVSGKLQPGYSNWSASIGYADVEVIGYRYSPIDKFRNYFIAKLRNSLPEPEASFAAGLLIGQKSGLSNNLQEILRMAGLTHIIAVSGYNLTVIIRAVRKIFSKFSRFQILSLTILLISLFVATTGMSPSILRALIVSLVMITSWYYGRKPKPVILLIFSMAVSALIEPYNALNSIGWYLSFGAFAGVIILAPIFINKIKRITLWKSVLVESFCAGLMTLPIIALSFNTISLAGIIANCLVVPIVPVAMLGSLLAGLAGFINPIFGSLVGLPVKLLLRFILDFSEAVSSLPGTNIKVSVSMQLVILFYLTIAISAILLYRKNPVVNVLQ